MSGGKRNKIVHVIGAFIAGGAEKFVTDLSVELSRNNDLTVLALSNRNDSAGISMKERLKENNVFFEQGPSKKVGLKTLLWLARIINKLEPDILNLHTPNTELAYYLISFFQAKKKIRLYRTIHNTVVTHNFFTKWAFKHNNTLASIACGEATFNVYKEVVNENLVVIQNGISFNWPIKNIENSIKNKAELELDVCNKHYICVGSMSGDTVKSAQKAQDIVIRAWKKANMGDRAAQLHFIGDGNLRESFEALKEGDSSIIFHGVQNNIYKWLLACDNLVLVSRFEGLPIVGIEAIGTGIRCVFSKINSLIELAPKDVLWVDVNDIDTLSDLFLESYLIDKHLDVVDVELFREKYSIKSTATKYSELYKS